MILNDISIHFKKFCILLMLIVSTITVKASATDSLFISDKVVNMELRFNYDAIEADRTVEPSYHEAELIYYLPGGEAKKLNVKIMVRGHFRRDTANCNFPPLFVNFKKSEIKNTLFENQEKLKLVTPCQDEKDVLSEYTVYKMYNKVTDLSMKARLVKVRYYDTGRGRKIFERYSYFTEDKDKIAERNNGFEHERFITAFEINKDNFKKLSVFEYMIGNIDWFFTFDHNIILIQPNDSAKATWVVPYDFDLSGFVDANYAQPEKGVDKAISKKRIYKGLCYSNAEFEETFDFFRKLRPEFESIINNMNGASNYSKKQMLKYISYFYTVIDNDKLKKREFYDACGKSIDYQIAY
jgi:hypothetical protein